MVFFFTNFCFPFVEQKPNPHSKFARELKVTPEMLNTLNENNEIVDGTTYCVVESVCQEEVDAIEFRLFVVVLNVSAAMCVWCEGIKVFSFFFFPQN